MRSCLWSYSHKLFPFVKAIILILTTPPLKSTKKPTKKNPQKTGNNLKVLIWQMPDSKASALFEHIYITLSSQYLTSSNKPPELIQNASTLKVQTRKELSSSRKKIMNHKVNFSLSRRLSVVAWVILLSASPCPDPGVLCSRTHTEIRKALLKIQKEDKKYGWLEVYSILPERMGGRADGDGGSKRAHMIQWERGNTLPEWGKMKGSRGERDLKSYEEKKKRQTGSSLIPERKNVYSIREMDVVF